MYNLLVRVGVVPKWFRRMIEAGGVAKFLAVAAVVALGFTTIAFLLFGLVEGDFGTAYVVLTNIESPFASNIEHTGWALVVSVLGYMLVPSLAGLVVGAVVERLTKEARRASGS